MKNIARMALQPGMEVAEDIFSYKNDLIVAAGTIIDETIIAKLTRYSIMCVSIKEEIDYATTHFEKVRLSPGFKEFEKVYNESLLTYKAIMISFATNNIPFHMNQLLQIHDKIASCADSEEKILDYLYNMLPSEDDMTHAHCLNSALIAGVFGSWLGLPNDEIKLLIKCAFCYDIGKLKLSNDLLWKPDKLTDVEYEKMKTHTVLGFEMLKDQGLDTHITNATLMHHERCDGSGYPLHLKANQIDIYAKYIAVIDSYEAMTSARTYRESLHAFRVIANFEQAGFHKYDEKILVPILRRIARTQLGLMVSLSDDTIAQIILINEQNLSRPLVKTDDVLIDLSKRPDLTIQNIY